MMMIEQRNGIEYRSVGAGERPRVEHGDQILVCPEFHISGYMPEVELWDLLDRTLETFTRRHSLTRVIVTHRGEIIASAFEHTTKFEERRGYPLGYGVFSMTGSDEAGTVFVVTLIHYERGKTPLEVTSKKANLE